LVEVLSCSHYSDTAKYVTASIFELSIAGEKADGTSSSIDGNIHQGEAPKTGESNMAFYWGILMVGFGLVAFVTRKQTINHKINHKKKIKL
jgi:LPXTG-motif cell wall-anchored protein